MGTANTPITRESPQNNAIANAMRATSMGTATEILHAAKRTACLKLSAMEDASPMRILEDMSCFTEYAVG